MLRHYFSLAIRHVARTKLYALISVTGLAIGFGAATLIGIYIHDELTYERWLPNNDRIYQSGFVGRERRVDYGPSDIGPLARERLCRAARGRDAAVPQQERQLPQTRRRRARRADRLGRCERVRRVPVPPW